MGLWPGHLAQANTAHSDGSAAERTGPFIYNMAMLMMEGQHVWCPLQADVLLKELILREVCCWCSTSTHFINKQRTRVGAQVWTGMQRVRAPYHTAVFQLLGSGT